MSDPARQPLDLGRFELCLNVADIARSLEFYGRLGFTRVGGEPEERWVILENSGTRLGLYQGHIRETMLNFRGADVFSAAAEMKARGLALETEAVREPDGTDGATLRDPDGHLIYLNTP